MNEAWMIWPKRLELKDTNLVYLYTSEAAAEQAIADTGEPRSEWAVVKREREE